MNFPSSWTLLSALGLFLFTISAAQGQETHEKWAVPGAQMRFPGEIESQPSSPDAGIIAILPNGGALPGPYPSAVVLDSAGHELASQCIWNNPEEGMGIVFTPPSDNGQIWIYLTGASSIGNPWTDTSPLHPSLLLFTRVGQGNLSDARAMAGQVPAGGVRMGQVPMIADRHNRFGRSDYFMSYYTGWLIAPEDGKYFIGTISSDGSTVLVDGQVAADWPGMHSPAAGRSGDKGTEITLMKGPHRLQYFSFSVEGTPLSQLIWRIPSSKGPVPGTPRMRDFLHSGSLYILTAESRRGPQPALFTRTALSYMDFGDQFVDLFDLRVPALDQSTNATFDWRFSDGSQAQGPEVLWPVVRGSPLSVTLTVSGSNGSSSSSHLLYPDTLPEGANVDNQSDRKAYAQALYNSLKGAPDQTNPAAAWPQSFWQILPQVVQGGEGEDVLGYLFEHCSASLGNLSPDEVKRMGNIFYDEVKARKTGALPVLNAIANGAADPSTRFNWGLKAVDFELLELGDVASARQVAASLKVDAFRGGKYDAELKLIAQGDVERIAGNTDLATQYYTAAQAAYQKAAAPAFHGFSGFADLNAQATPTPADGIVITSADSQNADWRKRTVLQNSYYTEVKNLIDQDDLDDARAKLDSWAIEFPLSKLGGDYAEAEAEYAIRFDDYDRAARILKAYRTHVDLSPQLAEVMQLEWDCDAELQRPADIKALAADIKKRFPDLPLAKEAIKALAGEMPKALLGNQWGRPQ